MKKIRLDVDALEISSFATETAEGQRGTVRGASGYTCYHTVGYYRTQCVDYPMSYWGEESCECVPIPETDPLVCPLDITLVDNTCPGVTGC
jgi:hypothetical protein